MRHSARTLVVLLAAGLVVLAAGCGGSSNTSAPPTGPTTTQQATTTMTTTGGGGGSFASAKNCLAFAGLAAQIAKAINPGGSSSPQTAAQELQALANAAPSDIRADLQTVAGAFTSYIQAVQNSGYKLGSNTPPTAAQLAALVSAAKVFNTPKLRQAEQHLTTWETQNCHS